MSIYVITCATYNYGRLSLGVVSKIVAVFATEELAKTYLKSKRSKYTEKDGITDHDDGKGFTINGPPYVSFVPFSYSYEEQELITEFETQDDHSNQ